MDTGLAGKVVVITGAASGIGLACARAFAAEDSALVLGDLDADGARSVADEHGGLGIGVDVADPGQARALVDTAVEQHGRLDVLVTCAGIFHSTPFDEIPISEWDRIVAVNLRGVFLVAQAALGPMTAQGSGRIVTIGSLAGQAGGLAAGAAYAASKGGVAALTKSIARFAAASGVRANCVNPGIITTPMTDQWAPGVLDRTVAQTPMQRPGTPDEVASVVVMLASDAASFVQGAQIDVNGGLIMD